jgi:hypothetical protein
MKRFVCALLFFAATTLTAAIQTPSSFSDSKSAPIASLPTTAYFHALAAASPRVKVESLGKTTLGEDFIMAVVTSAGNMRNLEKIRETARKLADPRGLSDEQIAQLARDGKSIVLVTCNIHSSEIASSQMAMEWAHALATANDAETKRRLDNVVLLLVRR